MKRKNIILIPCFIIALILIGLIVIKTNTSKETDNIEQKSTTETTKISNQTTNNNEEKEVSKGSTTSSSEHSNSTKEEDSQSKEEEKELEPLWEKEYQNNKLEIVNNNFESFSLMFNDVEIDKEDIGLHNLTQEIYCQEEEASITCLLSFLTTTGMSYFTYFLITADGQLLEKRGYEAEGYHHSTAYTSEGIFNYIDNKLYIVDISDSFGSSQDNIATTNLEVNILDNKLNLINNFSFNVEASQRIQSCDNRFLNSYDSSKYPEDKEEFTVVNDVLNLTCILVDYQDNESLYNITIDIPSQTYSTTKQSS